MALKHHWSGSKETQGSLGRLGSELLLPWVVDDEDESDDREIITTRFGLRCLDVISGEERLIMAPFSVHSAGHGAEDFTWSIFAQDERGLALALGVARSYDCAYHLFGFDGESWGQVLSDKREKRIAFYAQRFVAWEDPGELALEGFPLVGGALVCSGEPLTFAIDNTHAFAYDSGPDSPSSSEYEETLERSKYHPAPGPRRELLNLKEHPALLGALPREHRAHTSEQLQVKIYRFHDGLAILDEDWRGDVHALSYLEA